MSKVNIFTVGQSQRNWRRFRKNSSERLVLVLLSFVQYSVHDYVVYNASVVVTAGRGEEEG